MPGETAEEARREPTSDNFTSLYEHDYYAWLRSQVRALREHRINEVDALNLAEELEDVTRSMKKGLKSQLVRLIAHLLKWPVQAEHRKQNPSAGHRWLASIQNARDEINDDLAESPSLKSYLPEVFSKAYRAAINAGVEDTGLPESAFPASCPWFHERKGMLLADPWMTS